MKMKLQEHLVNLSIYLFMQLRQQLLIIQYLSELTVLYQKFVYMLLLILMLRQLFRVRDGC